MQSPDQAEIESEQAHVEALNERLNGCADIWNALRGNTAFEQRASFLWDTVIKPVYKDRMPKDAKLAVEVLEPTYNEWSGEIPHLKVDNGSSIKFFLLVDPPLDLPESLAERPGRLEMELNLARGSVGYGFRFQRFKEGDQGQFIRSEDPRNGISPKDVFYCFQMAQSG
ncbi:MAG: hypothetical protein UT95_C0002G0070 [Candidatus Curtissbacteria bacterium GW2011_GWB1_40_28]|nr:MAG: hypothetical protein UT95_C0002G0070 [Candidatus Curtissbacteria bacterium GW2011_GWB1_40_28]